MTNTYSSYKKTKISDSCGEYELSSHIKILMLIYSTVKKLIYIMSNY